MWRLQALGQVGALEGGGVCRLALGEEDRQGRDLVSRWMRELGLKVSVDQIGNALADEALLKVAEERALAAVATVCVAEDIDWERRSLARFAPVPFASQMIARNCATGMIFVPSRGGISHSIREYTAPEELEAGANVLLDVLLE